ncbi:helix-turn-helix transcriptional regulator [Halobacteriaceae archaeon GCM10025711]
MKQQEIVEELDWSEAKTSQVVGTLRDDGEIEVFRLGRENVLRLPDDEDS